VEGRRVGGRGGAPRGRDPRDRAGRRVGAGGDRPARGALVSGVVASRYRLIETLGGGGTSVVHRAEVAGGLLPGVAVKQLRPQFTWDAMLRRRFLREAELARTLDSPCVVRVIDSGEDDGVPFLVMELMRGDTLRRRLERERRLPEDDARSIFLALG